jgi:TusA-related sulfurtransferase
MMNNKDYVVTALLDVCDLRCPLPLLKAKRALQGLSEGSVLKVIATDPGSKRDFKAYIEHSNHEMLCSFEENSQFVYIIKKGVV